MSAVLSEPAPEPTLEQRKAVLVDRMYAALNPDPGHARTVRAVLDGLTPLLSEWHLTQLVESVEAAAVDVNRRLLAERYGPVLHRDERRVAVTRRG